MRLDSAHQEEEGAEGVRLVEPFFDDLIPTWSDYYAAQQYVHAELPCLLALSSSRIYAGHQKNNVE